MVTLYFGGLFRCGYDINVSDSCGVTPLMDAVRGDHLETVKFLLKFGVCSVIPAACNHQNYMYCILIIT